MNQYVAEPVKSFFTAPRPADTSLERVLVFRQKNVTKEQATRKELDLSRCAAAGDSLGVGD